MIKNSMIKKKRWEKPLLISLANKTPEEQVLLFCKTGQVGQGPDGYFGTCFINNSYQICRQWTTS
jgi:hypothetical protein